MQKKIDEKRIFFPSKKNGRPREKKFLNELASEFTGFSSIISNLVGFTLNGTRTLREILPENNFNFPKPPNLIRELIQQIPDKKAIVLDSFAGSGTTAHAVLNLNKQDNGNRKFILIEMEDYAETITAERVKRVINGYGEGNKIVKGTDGNFSFYKLGEPLFLENEFLNEDVGLDKIEEYVWYTETKMPFIKQEEAFLLGEKNSSAYYFYYDKDRMTTLDDRFLRNVKTKAEQYIIYADNCLLSKELMAKYTIIFKKIPRDISRF